MHVTVNAEPYSQPGCGMLVCLSVCVVIPSSPVLTIYMSAKAPELVWHADIVFKADVTDGNGL